MCLIFFQFESDLQKVKIERLRSSKAVEDYMETFERKKTQDLKVCLESKVTFLSISVVSSISREYL